MAVSNGGTSIIQGYLKPLGYQQITSLAAATALTPPNFARLAMIQAESQSVRWRDDGTNPTAAIGMILVANDILLYSGDFAAIKLIEVTGSAKVNITYYE